MAASTSTFWVILPVITILNVHIDLKVSALMWIAFNIVDKDELLKAVKCNILLIENWPNWTWNGTNPYKWLAIMHSVLITATELDY